MKHIKIQMTEAELAKRIDLSNEGGVPAAMFKSGAKLYRLGNGLWRISGYAADGNDVVAAVKELLE